MTASPRPGHDGSVPANYRPDAEVVDLCRDLIRIDTSNFGNDSGPGERAAAERVAELLDEVGIASELYETAPRRTSLVADWAPEGWTASLAAAGARPPRRRARQRRRLVGAAVRRRGGRRLRLGPRRGGHEGLRRHGAQRRPRPGPGRAAPRRPIRLIFTADEEAGSGLGATYLVDEHREVLEGCEEAIGEVGGFSLTVRDDLRLYLIQTAEKGMAWLNLIADGTAGHGSFRNDDNAVTELAAAVARIGAYEWPHKITDAQRAFLEAVSEAFGIELDPDRAEETLARLGSIARMVGATMANTANPTMLAAGYKHNVIPGRATAAIDGRFVPGGEDEFYTTIAELLGDKVRYEVSVSQPAVETEFSGALVEAMQACLAAEDPAARTVPYLMSGGTDGKAWHRAGIRCFGFTPLRLPPELDFVSMFHGVDERVPVASLEFGARVLDRFLDQA